MRKTKCIQAAVITTAMLLIPTLGLLCPASQENTPTTNHPDTTILLQTESGTAEVSWREYLVGVVAAEMPASFEPEALKAQAVAAHTYTLNRYKDGQPVPTDPSVFLAYKSPEQRQQKFGMDTKSEQKIEQAVDAVWDQIILYGGEPIVAAFHAMSGGRTQDSADVWGGALPYLSAADSSAETTLPGFTTDIRLSSEQLRQIVSQQLPQTTLQGNPASWIEVVSRTGSDYADKVRVGNVTMSGGEARSLFSLPSADFTVSWQNGEIVFTCRGRGHGVGMSQYGANQLALQGQTYDQILAHYYAGTSLQTLPHS